MQQSDPGFRRQIYFLLIVISCGLMLGRIIALDNVFDQSASRIKYNAISGRLKDKQKELGEKGYSAEQMEAALGEMSLKLQREALDIRRPFLSANDRSRWCTVRALVEPEMRVHDENGRTIWYAIDHVQSQTGWDTIDMVKHPVPPGNPDAPSYLFSSKPPLLPTLMSVPYFLLYHLSGGTLSFEKDPYLIVRVSLIILNLLPLAFCWFLMSRLIDRFAQTDWSRYFCMSTLCFGTFASTFVVTLNNHLPGICCLIISLYAVIRILFDQQRQLRYFIIAGLFGSLIVACELPALAYCAGISAALFYIAPRKTLLGLVPMLLLVATGFFATNYIAHQTVTPAYANRDWYDYTYERGGKVRESYWRNRIGIDLGEESTYDYFINTTIGHHGIFSLSPIWILSVLGLALAIFQRNDRTLLYAALFILGLSLLCYVFYLTRSQVDRNYGGMCAGLRWMFWFIPLWILAMLPMTDRLSRFAIGRGLCLTLLLFSLLSIAYPLWNPWDHPWIYHFMHYLALL
ncbi:MAG: hypothetical protein ACRC10_11975 [Thermoguttaceae bacterium]